jgi:hypothetical protein
MSSVFFIKKINVAGQGGNHSQADLVKFGYLKTMKGKKKKG